MTKLTALVERLNDNSTTTVRIVPVVVDGETQLYDIYIGERWIGSRRTLGQCERAVRHRSVVS